MPAEKPTPITPEGKRAAERIRTIFYSIAAANLVLVAIVIWLGAARKAEPPDARARAVAEMEAVFGRALAAYNTADGEGFLACFSAKTGAATGAALFWTKIETEQRRYFGSISVNGLAAPPKADDGNAGTLVYGVTCERRLRLKLRAGFARESGEMKLIEWRIEQP